MSNLFPDERVRSTYEIDFEHWYKEGKRGLLFDIDNTLVPHGAPADEKAIALFKRLQNIGFQTVLISNNGEPRVRSFADQVGSLYIFKANKPSVKNYLKACELMKITKEQALFIGDQIFTDIWGANRAGIRTILVNPIHPKEEIQIILKRIPEWFILKAWEISRRRSVTVEKQKRIR